MQVRTAIITVSDTRSTEDDLSGKVLVDLLTAIDAQIMERRIVSDDLKALTEILRDLADRADMDLVITTGGTGFSGRDNTPEATRAVIEKEAPGIAEAMRAQTLKKTPMAMLSRGICGIRNRTLIINLPGSPKAVEECFEVIRPVLQHAVGLLKGETEHKIVN